MPMLGSWCCSGKPVKGEYREFLSQGRRTQAVLVDRATALTKFQELSMQALATSEAAG